METNVLKTKFKKMDAGFPNIKVIQLTFLHFNIPFIHSFKSSICVS